MLYWGMMSKPTSPAGGTVTTGETQETRWRRPRAVLFDLDDTLYSREAAFGRWAAGFLTHRLGLHDDKERQDVLDWLAGLDADGYGSKQALFTALHGRYPALRGVAETSVERFYDELLAEITPEEGAETLLAALERAGLPFGVITNGSARQWHKLERLGLTGRTACLFVSGTFGARKPAPAIFLAAADCLGVAPDAVLFVGDHPTNDIRGARAVGMTTAWLHRGKPWPPGEDPSVKPDLTLDRLTDLLPWLTR